MSAIFHRSAPTDLVRIGVIAGAGSHTFAIWGNVMNPSQGFIRTTGMVCTHAWSVRPDQGHRLRERYPGIEQVAHPTDMIGKINGVYIDDINAISIYPTLVRPFLEAGIPAFVNRPFATSVVKGQEMVDTAARCGTALLTASTWEYTESVGDLRAKAADMADIKGYVAHNSMSDYYTHGLHGVWYIYSSLRDEIRKGRGRMTAAAYHTPDWRTPNGMVVFEHEHPQRRYYGALQLIGGADGHAYLRIFGDHRGDAEGKIPARASAFRYNTWNALQLVIQEMFETNVSPETGEDMMEKLTMYLLPFYSILERNGEMVRREEMGTWEMPYPSPAMKKGNEPYDGAFQEMYTETELESVLRSFS
ncbi:MAG: hypothetical protein FJY97_12000 [candidate division Zixibacteria bacterium]|nr:hypothetical protein [candidate division Zixibacteria bacterium]